MIVLLSESKKMNLDRDVEINRTKPRFAAQVDELVETLREFSAPQLGKAMGISEELAALNHDRFAEFYDAEPRPAISAFAGDAYQSLDVESFTPQELERSQGVLRILSGLYGLLRPADEIVPHRLEMHTKLKTSKAKDLYGFWGTQIAELAELNLAESVGDKVFLNLASNEYSKAVKSPASPVVSPRFEDIGKNGKRRVMPLYAKRARGAMTAWIIKQNITRVEDLKDFDAYGYEYDPENSTDEAPVFWR